MTRGDVEGDSGGQTGPGYTNIRVLIYKGKNCSDTMLDGVFDRMGNAMSQVYNNTSDIPGWKVTSHTCNFDDADYPDLNIIESFREWLCDNSYLERGCHIVLHEHDRQRVIETVTHLSLVIRVR